MYIPVLVKTIDEVCPEAFINLKRPTTLSGKVTTCYNCGSPLFYQVVSLVEGTEDATDTDIYCAVCGKLQGGIFLDPFNEMGKDEE